jgi:excinuclease ABC subunit C
VLELNVPIEFHADRDEEFFGYLPARPAVCLVEPHEQNAHPYLIRTSDLRSRLQRLLGPPDPSTKRLNLREFARGIQFRETPSKFEQTLAYYFEARRLFPKRYQQMARLRPAAVLKLNLRNAYPRCFATRHVTVDESGVPTGGAFYGPFPSRRSAQAFAEKMLDFFKVRRCQIKIRRDPTFPGCIYSEMKMCLAPCFAGCSKEEYDAEVQRLQTFLDTGGVSLATGLEQQREAASEELDFERAAAIHKRIEKLDDVLRGRPEIARRIQDVDAVILQKAVGEQAVAVFPVRGGRLQPHLLLQFGDTSQPRSAEEAVREHLEGVMSSVAPPTTAIRQSALELGEHLALVGRWFYSNPRDGEIFFRDKDWPYRRILRACARLLLPKAEEATQNPSTGEIAKTEGTP